MRLIDWLALGIVAVCILGIVVMASGWICHGVVGLTDELQGLDDH